MLYRFNVVAILIWLGVCLYQPAEVSCSTGGGAGAGSKAGRVMRRACASLFGGVIALSGTAGTITGTISVAPAIAQIPLYEDYTAVSGSVVRSNAGKTQRESQVLDTSSFYTLDRNLINEKLDTLLSRIAVQVQKEYWNDIILEIKVAAPVLTKTRFSLASDSQVAQTFGLSSEAQARELEGKRLELAYALGQLNDFCLSHRVLYFNKLDLEAVDLIKNGDDGARGENALEQDGEEARALVDSAKEIVTELKSLI
jgi:hypothetical protein